MGFVPPFMMEKGMGNRWICLLLLVASQPVFAQDFRVRVTSEGEPLGYAYVFINEHDYASVDSAGMIYISETKLQPGDTVSARFVGIESTAFVYDGNRPEGSVIPLDLRPIPIDEVVVTARIPSEWRAR